MFKKGLLTLLLILVCAFAGLLLMSSSVLHQITTENLNKVKSLASNYGLHNVEIQFYKTHLSGVSSIIWRGVEISALKGHSKSLIPVRAYIDRVSAKISSFSPFQVKVSFEDFKIGGASEKTDGNIEFLFSGKSLSLYTAPESWTINALAREVASALSTLSTGGKIPQRFQIDAFLTLRTSEVSQAVRILARKFTVGFGMVLSKEDLKNFLINVPGKYTAAEIALIANYPYRALKLVDLKGKAEHEARQASVRDPSFPEDAYRHVLWSYLLTREYGNEFAEEVTDAHETGMKNVNVFDREMDLINNRIGREYANSHVRQDDLIKKIKEDKRVIQKVESLQ